MITALNGFTSTDNMVLFSKAPNILTISGYGTFTKGKLEVTLSQQTSDSVSITINDYTYYSGIDFEYSTDLPTLVFNLCGVIPNAYQDSTFTNKFYVLDVNSYSSTLEADIVFTKPQGTIQDIRVDIYNNGEFFTSLNKKVFGDDIEFKLDVLDSIASYNKTIPISLYIWGVGSIDNLYLTKGYSTDVILKKGLMLSTNKSYIAQEWFPFYSFESTTGTLRWLDYSNNVMSTQSVPIDEGYNELELDLNAYSIELEVNSKVYSFFINKKQTNAQSITRIVFQNSYGGESFIDFIGDKQHSLEVSNDIYNQSLYKRESFNKVIYNKSLTRSKTITSQYVNDISIFDELLKSYNVYEVDNDLSKPIIITNVSIDEVRPSLYKVSITYEI